jgi:hypothetical protein
MAETFTYDATPPAEVVSSIEADEAESLAIGEELEAAHESLLAGKYKNAQELEQAYRRSLVDKIQMKKDMKAKRSTKKKTTRTLRMNQKILLLTSSVK